MKKITELSSSATTPLFLSSKAKLSSRQQFALVYFGLLFTIVSLACFGGLLWRGILNNTRDPGGFELLGYLKGSPAISLFVSAIICAIIGYWLLDAAGATEENIIEKHLTWDIFLKAICAATATIMLIFIVRNFSGVQQQNVYILFVVALLLPRLSQLDIFGVKMGIREKVENLSEMLKALPDYVLGSQYQADEDYELAEQSYRLSLAKSSDFWPSIFGLASIYHEKKQYERAILEYEKVLALDPSHIHVFNNLAEVYLNAPPSTRDIKKALDMANRALAIIPEYSSALYYKGEALNKMKETCYYAEAIDIFTDLVDNRKLPTEQHWAMYELLIAKSNLGTRVTIDYLEKILSESLDKGNGEGRSFLEFLSDKDEIARFDQKDIAVINQFIKTNSNFS